MSTTPVTTADGDGDGRRKKASTPVALAAGACSRASGSAASALDPSVLSDLSLFADLCEALQRRCEDGEDEGLPPASATNTCAGTDGECMSAAAHEAARQWWEWRGQDSGGESTGAAIMAIAAFRLADEGPPPQQVKQVKQSQRKRNHHESHTGGTGGGGSSGLVARPIDLHTVRPLSLLLQQSHYKHRNAVGSSGRPVLYTANNAAESGGGAATTTSATTGEASVPTSCLYRFVGSVHSHSAHLPTVPPSPPPGLSAVPAAHQSHPCLTVTIGREPSTSSLEASKTAVKGSLTYHRRLRRSSLGIDADAAEKRTMPPAESQQFAHSASLALPAFAQISRQHITLSLEEFEYNATTPVRTTTGSSGCSPSPQWRVVAEDCGALNGTIAMIPERTTMDGGSAPPAPPPAPSWLALRLCPRTPTVILNAQIEKPQALPRSTSSAPPVLVEGDNNGRVAWLALAPDDPSVYVAVGLFPSHVLEAYVRHCKGRVKNRGGNARPRYEASPQLPRTLLPVVGSAEEVVDVDWEPEEGNEGDNVQATHGIGSCDAGTTFTASMVPTNTTQQLTQNTQPSGGGRRRRKPKSGAVASAGGSTTSASVLSPAQQIHSAIQRGADRSPAIPVVLLPPPTGNNTTTTVKKRGNNNKGKTAAHSDEKAVTSATKPAPDDEGPDRDDVDGISETAAVATSTTTHTTMAAADDTLMAMFPATTTTTLLSPSISSQPQPLHIRSGAGAKRARMEEEENDYGDNTTACSKGQGCATDHRPSDDEGDTATTATDRPRSSETTGGRAPSDRLLPHRPSARSSAAAHHGSASMLCVPPSVAEWLASTCGDGTDDGTGASSLLRAPSAEHPIHILVLPTTVVGTATHAHILDDRPLLRALAAVGLIIVGVGGLEAAAMAGAAAKKQHRATTTTTTTTASSAYHQRELLDDFLVAAAAKVRYIVASASPPIADIEAGLLACLPSAAAVVQPRWLQAIMRPLEKKPPAPSSRIRDPTAPSISSSSSSSSSVFHFFRPGKHDLYGPVGRVLRRDRCLERDRGCSIPRLLACYRPAERRHLFVPLRFWIHPRADTMPAAETPSQFTRLSVIIRASGGTVVEDPFTGDANVLVFPSLPSPSQTTEGGSGDGGDVLGTFNWGLGGGQSDDDEDDDTDSNEEGESDDSNGASCSSPAPGSDGDDNDNHNKTRRRRRRSGASPEDTARRRRLAQRRRHTAALLPEGLSTLRTVAATCRAAVEAALRLSPQTKLRRRGLAVAFRLWVLDRVLAVQGKPLPPPMPLNLIGLTSAGSSSGVGGAAAMAPVSFLNPNDVPKDASESCRVLGLCTPDDVATAILRHERALPLRTLPR